MRNAAKLKKFDIRSDLSRRPWEKKFIFIRLCAYCRERQNQPLVRNEFFADSLLKIYLALSRVCRSNLPWIYE